MSFVARTTDRELNAPNDPLDAFLTFDAYLGGNSNCYYRPGKHDKSITRLTMLSLQTWFSIARYVAGGETSGSVYDRRGGLLRR